MKILLCLLLIGAAFSAEASYTQLELTFLDYFAQQCFTQLNIPSTTGSGYENAVLYGTYQPYANDPNFKNFLFCYMDQLGLIDYTTANVNTQQFQTLFDINYPPAQVTQVMNTCIAQETHQGSLIDQTYAFFTCFWANESFQM